MTLIRKWALAVCSALLLTSYSATTNAQPNSNLDPTQNYVTGNLTTWSSGGSSTTGAWQNVGQWGGSLQCWGPGDPGYCGPLPYVNSNGYGNINFSYGLTDLYQVVNIANALPHSGTGLRVNGFNFGFQAKNGNGWDNGQQDVLVAYVNFYDAKGGVAQTYNYGAYTNKQYNWNYFSFSETFANPYDAKNLSTARYGFVGGDTNGWAGPYGPEVNSISFSLKYTVDPCHVNKLSSPLCPGYQEEMAKLNPPVSAQSESAPPVISATNSSTTIELPQPQSTGGSAPTIENRQSVTFTSTAATPTALDPKPRPGTVAITGERDRASVIAGILRKEQNRMAAVESSAVDAAVIQAQQQSQTAQEQSLQISAATVSASQSSAQSAATMTIPMVSTGSQMPSSAAIATSAVQTGQGLRVNESIPQFVARADTDNASEGLKFTGLSSMPNFANPQPRVAEQQTESAPGPAVNTRAPDNDAAGGVSIAAMARTPQGFEAYMSQLPDSAFYAPKEIYRNQRVVDNARVQRALSGASDRLHQQMVDQQYKK